MVPIIVPVYMRQSSITPLSSGHQSYSAHCHTGYSYLCQAISLALHRIAVTIEGPLLYVRTVMECIFGVVWVFLLARGISGSFLIARRWVWGKSIACFLFVSNSHIFDPSFRVPDLTFDTLLSSCDLYLRLSRVG